jgi:hypothetical protein
MSPRANEGANSPRESSGSSGIKRKASQPSLLMNRKILTMCRAFAQAAMHVDMVIMEEPALSGSEHNAAERIRLTRPSQILHKVKRA